MLNQTMATAGPNPVREHVMTAGQSMLMPWPCEKCGKVMQVAIDSDEVIACDGCGYTLHRCRRCKSVQVLRPEGVRCHTCGALMSSGPSRWIWLLLGLLTLLGLAWFLLHR